MCKRNLRAYNYISIHFFNILTYSITFPNSAAETQEKGVKYAQMYQEGNQNDVINVVLMFLFPILNSLPALLPPSSNT